MSEEPAHSEAPLGLWELQQFMAELRQPRAQDLEIIDGHIAHVEGDPNAEGLCAVFLCLAKQLQRVPPFGALAGSKRTAAGPRPRLRRLLWAVPATSPLVRYKLLVRRSVVVAVLDACNTALSSISAAAVRTLLTVYGGVRSTSLSKILSLRGGGADLRRRLRKAASRSKSLAWLVDGLHLHGSMIAAMANFFHVHLLRPHLTEPGQIFIEEEMTQALLNRLEREHTDNPVAYVDSRRIMPKRLSAKRTLHVVTAAGPEDRPPPVWITSVAATEYAVEALYKPPAYYVFARRVREAPAWTARCAAGQVVTAEAGCIAIMSRRLAELEERFAHALDGVHVLTARFPRSLGVAVDCWLGGFDASLVGSLGRPPPMEQVRVVVPSSVDKTQVPSRLRPYSLTVADIRAMISRAAMGDIRVLVLHQAQNFGLVFLVHILENLGHLRIIITGCPDAPPRAGTLGDPVPALVVLAKDRCTPVQEVDMPMPSAEALASVMWLPNLADVKTFVEAHIPVLELPVQWCGPRGELVERVFGLDELRTYRQAPGERLAKLFRMEGVPQLLDRLLVPYCTDSFAFSASADPLVESVVLAMPPFCRVVAATDAIAREFMSLLMQRVNRVRGAQGHVEAMDQEVQLWRDQTERGRPKSPAYLPIYPGSHVRVGHSDVRQVTRMSARFASGRRPVAQAYSGNLSVRIATSRGRTMSHHADAIRLRSDVVRAECMSATQCTEYYDPVLFVLMSGMKPGLLLKLTQHARVICMVGSADLIKSTANLPRERVPSTLGIAPGS